MHQRLKTFLLLAIFICGLMVTVGCGLSQAAVLDTYLENFDSCKDDTSIHGIDSWDVTQGDTDNAVTQDNLTFSGSGKSLKLSGALTTTEVARSASYGGLTPTWVRFRVRPSVSGQTPAVPTSGIAAVCLDYSGRVLVSDGASWIDTGHTYDTEDWCDITLKLNFKTHRYDFYCVDSNVPDVHFTPLKTNLEFINTSINSLSALKLHGSYSLDEASDVYLDDILVAYIDQLEIISLPQKLMSAQASSPITIQLQNSLSEPQTAMVDITLELKSTSGNGRFSLDIEPWVDVEQVVLPKNAQNVNFYYKDTASGKPLITAAEYPDQGFTDASQQLEIVSQIASFDVIVRSPQVAGEPFNIKITAKNEDGTINDAYAGTVALSADYISPSGGSFNISPVSVSGFVKGSLEASIVYPDCGLINITVKDSDNQSKSGTSPQIQFLPAGFTLSADNFQTVAKPFSLMLTAKNAAGATTPNYNSAVNLYPVGISPLDIANAKLSPSEVSGASFKGGSADLSASYNLYGTIKIRAEDALDTTKTGLSNEINFLPKGISVGVQPAVGGRDFFYIGEPINIILKAEDEIGNPIPNYLGIMELSSATGLTLASRYAFTYEDAGQHTLVATPTQAGSYIVAARAEGGLLTAESGAITVKNASIQVIDTTSPVGTGEVLIQLVDEEGNVITSENNLVISIKAIESSANNTVSLPSESVTFTAGRAIIPVSNSEAEVVTILPSSDFKINIKEGTITFGRVGKTGISTQMWRELKKKKKR